ncbi:hypothetical protein VTL71DRAFT_5592, partial [Oculimacula yallundae]
MYVAIQVACILRHHQQLFEIDEHDGVQNSVALSSKEFSSAWRMLLKSSPEDCLASFMICIKAEDPSPPDILSSPAADVVFC